MFEIYFAVGGYHTSIRCLSLADAQKLWDHLSTIPQITMTQTRP